MPSPHTIDGVEVELDDDITPADLDKGGQPRAEGDLDEDLLAEAEADDSAEDDTAEEV